MPAEDEDVWEQVDAVDKHGDEGGDWAEPDSEASVSDPRLGTRPASWGPTSSSLALRMRLMLIFSATVSMCGWSRSC